jgi:predicted nucleic acid-binding Zn ribbon protein
LKNIGELLRDYLTREGMGELDDLVSIKGAWERIVGPEMADRSEPFKLQKGSLYIGVGSHAWAQEIHYRKEGIKRGIQEELGLNIERVIIKKINLR